MRALHNQQKELTAELTVAKQTAEQVRLVVRVNFSVLELRVSFLYENIVGIRIHVESWNLITRTVWVLICKLLLYFAQHQPITQHNTASTHYLPSPAYVPRM